MSLPKYMFKIHFRLLNEVFIWIYFNDPHFYYEFTLNCPNDLKVLFHTYTCQRLCNTISIIHKLQF